MKHKGNVRFSLKRAKSQQNSPQTQPFTQLYATSNFAFSLLSVTVSLTRWFPLKQATHILLLFIEVVSLWAQSTGSSDVTMPALLLCWSAPAGEVMDSKTLPAPVSWPCSSVVNRLMRDVNKVTAARWKDKSTQRCSVSSSLSEVTFLKGPSDRSVSPLPAVRWKDGNGAKIEWLKHGEI